MSAVSAATKCSTALQKIQIDGEVRWGIIGVGNVCEIKSGPAFYKCRGSRLVAVMRRTGAKARDFARRHNVPAAYDTVEKILLDKQMNAVYIATPPGTHYEIAMKCLAAGLPTYVEKPVARNARETRLLVEAFETAKIPLFVAYYRRGHTKFREAREFVQSGRLGSITSVSYSLMRPVFRVPAGGSLPWRLQAEHSGGGLIMDIGCHTIDIIDFMVGPLSHVSGSSANLVSPYSVEDSVTIQAKCVNSGALVSMQWSFACAPGIFDDTIIIRGTQGELRMSTFGHEPVQLRTLDLTAGVDSYDLQKNNAEQKVEPLKLESIQYEPDAHAHQGLVQLIVDELLGGEKSPSKGANAIRVAEILDQSLARYYDGRDDNFWEREGNWPGQRRTRQRLTTTTTAT